MIKSFHHYQNKKTEPRLIPKPWPDMKPNYSKGKPFVAKIGFNWFSFNYHLAKSGFALLWFQKSDDKAGNSLQCTTVKLADGDAQ